MKTMNEQERWGLEMLTVTMDELLASPDCKASPREALDMKAGLTWLKEAVKPRRRPEHDRRTYPTPGAFPLAPIPNDPNFRV